MRSYGSTAAQRSRNGPDSQHTSRVKKAGRAAAKLVQWWQAGVYRESRVARRSCRLRASAKLAPRLWKTKNGGRRGSLVALPQCRPVDGDGRGTVSFRSCLVPMRAPTSSRGNPVTSREKSVVTNYGASPVASSPRVRPADGESSATRRMSWKCSGPHGKNCLESWLLTSTMETQSHATSAARILREKLQTHSHATSAARRGELRETAASNWPWQSMPACRATPRAPWCRRASLAP